jgi:hypothetical protein
MRGRRIRVLPGTAPGNGRRDFGSGELRSSRAMSISCVKSVGKSITRCARRRGEGSAKTGRRCTLARPESAKNLVAGTADSGEIFWQPGGDLSRDLGGEGEEGAVLFIGTG